MVNQVLKPLVYGLKPLIHVVNQVLKPLVYGLKPLVYGLKPLVHIVEEILKALIHRLKALFHQHPLSFQLLLQANEPFRAPGQVNHPLPFGQVTSKIVLKLLLQDPLDDLGYSSLSHGRSS